MSCHVCFLFSRVGKGERLGIGTGTRNALVCACDAMILGLGFCFGFSVPYGKANGVHVDKHN